MFCLLYCSGIVWLSVVGLICGEFELEFVCDMMSELLFVLNFFDGIYFVDFDGDFYDFEVL